MKQPQSNHILSVDGLKLDYTIEQANDPIAVLCIFHGHGEHKGRYAHVMSYLANRGIACVAFDFRGHGLSEGKRGHIPNIEMVMNDVEECLKFARVNFLDTPIFLYGHSFGGCVVLNYVLKRPISELSGFIASSPWLSLAFEPPGWKTKLGDFMSSLWPKFTMESKLDTSGLSKVRAAVEAYEQDPLVHSKVSARFFSEVTKAGRYVVNHPGFGLPGLVYHGNADPIIDFATTHEMAKKSENVKFHTLEGVYHEPHNDAEQEDVLNLLGDWIQTTIQSG